MDRRFATTLLLPAMLTLVGCGRSSEPGVSGSPESPVQTATPAVSQSESPIPSAAPPGFPAEPQLAPQVQAQVDSATELLTQGKFQESLTELDQLIAEQPELAKGYSRRAAVRHRLGLNMEAVADFTKAIELRPNDAELHNNRGFIFMMQRRITDALEDFNTAIRLNPRYSTAYNNRGLAYLTDGNHLQAISDFTSALELNPKYIDALNNRGYALLMAENYVTAAKDFELALKIEPENLNALNNRGLLLHRTGEFKAAVADFTQCLLLAPNTPKYFQQRAASYAKLELLSNAQADLDRAGFLARIQAYDRAIRKDPNATGPRLGKARFLFDSGENDAALAEIEAAIKAAPEEQEPLLARGSFWKSHQQFDKTMADCTLALELGYSLDAYALRGDAAFELGDYEQAVADYKMARRLDDKVAEAINRYAEQLAADGRTAEAAELRKQGKILQTAGEDHPEKVTNAAFIE